jgi:uncharacterized membrane protein YfcA
MKSRVWRSRAKKRHGAWWRLSLDVRPGAVGYAVEGAKYLLIATGATLVASIGGIGEAWHAQELRPVFTTLVSYFFAGFMASIVAWTLLTGATVRAAEARVERDRRRSRRLWRGVTWCFFVGALFGSFGIGAIGGAGVTIIAQFWK